MRKHSRVTTRIFAGICAGTLLAGCSMPPGTIGSRTGQLIAAAGPPTETVELNKDRRLLRYARPGCVETYSDDTGTVVQVYADGTACAAPERRS